MSSVESGAGHRSIDEWASEMRTRSSWGGEATAGHRAKRGFNKIWARTLRSMPFDRSVDLGQDGARLFDYTPICDGLIIGRIPRGGHDLKRLRETEGVTAVISLNEEWELRDCSWTQRMVPSAGLQWLHLPTPDFSAPNMGDLITAVEFIFKHTGSTLGGFQSGAKAGEKRGTVYVHCNRGRSRSCIVVACFLMALRCWPCNKAIDEIRKVRPEITMGPPFSSFWINLKRFQGG
eukprot:CAMPEP_0206214572 /NCGR_PEP_ID=MMETSP0047_2-20121206/1740_1 /ASSEMBLY_ACC=CAM_ASM_000192 /TAXON_ID=195065 /ORGANISM="Chroomonas mesostigmatica_cf, Strain CCMP1168" /LENGTH=233 /DNA_ID=CAMNT_0053636823 /DNA_START=45 /DNA_END=743 /DNA_ORIENTATION=-